MPDYQYVKVKFMLEIEFSFSGDEMEYCETFQEIIQRARELASAEVIGDIVREKIEHSPA